MTEKNQPTDLVAEIERGVTIGEFPEFQPGDTIKVHVRVVEGEKERIQMFQGDVIARRAVKTATELPDQLLGVPIGVP